MFPGSSMVEQEAVNFEVAGSSPAPGAIVNPSVCAGGFTFEEEFRCNGFNYTLACITCHGWQV